MKPNTKIRFTFWKREGKTATPVLDLIFRGAGSEPTTFFDRTRIEKIVKGPSGIKGAGFNYYGAKGHDSIKRHFFINKNYGGCQNDAGWVVVADKVEVCKGNWMGGRGWENFPRFLYAKQNGGCKWADVNCVGEGDVMTISIL